jgi:hypothetical protein
MFDIKEAMYRVLEANFDVLVEQYGEAVNFEVKQEDAHEFKRELLIALGSFLDRVNNDL